MSDAGIVSTTYRKRGQKRKGAWLSLLAIPVASLIIVVAPVWIIQPFRPQTPRGLELAYIMRSWSPLLTLAGLAVGSFLTIFLWRGARWWLKPALIILLAIAAGSAWFARQNYFEWMFNPISNADFAIVEDASFVDDKDYVIAVELNGDPVAYPVRQLAYHHLIQDVVGGIPIVTTY